MESLMAPRRARHLSYCVAAAAMAAVAALGGHPGYRVGRSRGSAATPTGKDIIRHAECQTYAFAAIRAAQPYATTRAAESLTRHLAMI